MSIPLPSGKSVVLGAAGIVLAGTITAAARMTVEAWDGKMNVQTYQTDRMRDSLIDVGRHSIDSVWRAHIDHRTHVLLCKAVPTDTECP